MTAIPQQNSDLQPGIDALPTRYGRAVVRIGEGEIVDGVEAAKARDFAAQRTQQQTKEGDFGPLAIIGLVAAAEAVLLYFWLGS